MEFYGGDRIFFMTASRFQFSLNDESFFKDIKRKFMEKNLPRWLLKNVWIFKNEFLKLLHEHVNFSMMVVEILSFFR
jgi:hypothetical protein